MRIVFMGTPEFAVPSLVAASQSHQVVGVFTQTDKPSGRGKKMTFSPIKEKALELFIPVFQPEKINAEDAIATIRELAPDVIVVVAYGQILKQTLLDIPTFGCINVHGSLLPHLRGAAPIQSAILEGLNETGVTTMHMAKGLDSGDIIDQRIIRIESTDTAGQLHDTLMLLGADLLKVSLDQIATGTAKRTPQNHDEATYCTLIQKEMARINWSQSAVSIERLVRAYNPWPVAFTSFGGEVFKVFEAIVEPINSEHEPGTLVQVDHQSIAVQTGDGCLRIVSLQTPASKRMTTQAYLLGHKMSPGSIFGV
jgi:methionyl-tRNA formyltransferase